MTKNILTSEQPAQSAPNLDAQPDAAALNLRVITCTHCGKAVTPGFPWDESNGPFVLRGFVECPECIETQPDAAPDNAWRPIETAPKDGTWILLYPKDGNGVICTGSWATWRDGDSGWAAGGGWFEPDDVSHWIPLPDPPK